MSQTTIELREKFLYTLDWLLAVTRRHTGHLQFSLVHVNFSNPGLLGDTYGAQEAAHRLDDTLINLKSSFRRTDLVARDGLDFWVLVPFTPADELQADKVGEIIAIASQNSLEIVERDISFFSLPFSSPELNPDYTAEEFLAYLKKNHLRLASHEIQLPAVNSQEPSAFPE